MKSVVVALCVLALATGTCINAIRPDELVEGILNQQGDDVMRSLGSLFGLESGYEKKTDHGAYALAKFIVKPSKAEGFIEAFKKTKEEAEGAKGYVKYNLVKTVDDNISFISWTEWRSIEELVEYLKSDGARDLIEYTIKEDIVTLVTGVKPIA